MRFHGLSLAVVFLACLSFGACGGEEASLFSTEDARSCAKNFHGALLAGKLDDAVALCHVPFMFRGRSWPSVEVLKSNLVRQVTDPRVGQHAGKDAAFEVQSWKQLVKDGGRSGFSLPKAKEDRIKVLEERGLSEGDYLVRVASPDKTGWFLVLGEEGGLLKIRAFF